MEYRAHKIEIEPIEDAAARTDLPELRRRESPIRQRREASRPTPEEVRTSDQRTTARRRGGLRASANRVKAATEAVL